MARLFPDTQLPDDISNKPERDVAHFLCQQLPSNVRIYHSYPWLNKEGHTLREGEADFVILDPRYGILIVEVKGGDIKYDSGREQWYRTNGNHAPKDPYDQASKSHRYFEKIIREREFRGGNELPFLRGRMVIFPDTLYDGNFPRGGCAEITLDARNLQQFNERIKAIFQSLPGANFVTDGIENDVVNRIHKALYPNFNFTPALFRQIEKQENALLRFTEEQSDLIDSIVEGTNYRAMVQGVAGSGKTVLALHLAYQLAETKPEGKVLLVCFNEQLASWIDESLTPDYKKRIVATTYHKLCSDWTSKAPGLKWPRVDKNNPDFWANEAPDLLANAIDIMPNERFDAVVVDEGQDFRSEWWDTLELIGTDPGSNPFLVFYDENQKIYDVGESVDLPDLVGPFRLKYNCRNTTSISNYSSSLIGQKIPAKPGAPDGEAPDFQYVENHDAVKKEVLATARSWLNAGKIEPNKIAIVSTGAINKSSMFAEKRIGNIPITEDISAWRNGQGVLLTTVWKFKGLEADAMILCDAKGITNHFTKQHAYVACSRAKHLLKIVSTSENW
jgi:hypothetical protein